MRQSCRVHSSFDFVVWGFRPGQYGCFAKLAKPIKIFGERNTGTTAIASALEGVEEAIWAASLDSDPQKSWVDEVGIQGLVADIPRPWRRLYRYASRDLLFRNLGPLSGWKHGVPIFHEDFVRHDVNVAFTVRDPYSWVLALHRHPYHCLHEMEPTLEEFAQLPWLTMERDGLAPIVPSPADLWNLKLASYAKFIEEAEQYGVKTDIIRFEKFVLNPVEELERVLAGFDISAKGLSYDANSTKKGGLTGNARRDYYAKEKWRAEISPDTVGLLTEQIDWEIASKFGYDRWSV